MTAVNQKAPFAGLLLCGGEGSRLGFPIAKAYVPLRGLPLFAHAAYGMLDFIHETYLFIVVSPEHRRLYEQIIVLFPASTIVFGGSERCVSVINGMKAVTNSGQPCSGIFIHDACRPFIPHQIMPELAKTLQNGDIDACAPALPCRDTVKRVQHDNITVDATMLRNSLRLVQTPQLLSIKVVEHITQADIELTDAITDDLSFAETLGLSSVLIQGDKSLHKLTDADDYAELIRIYDETVSSALPACLSSSGFDAHAYDTPESAESITLAGISIPFHRAIIGHSDGDVVFHALTDAILGCCAARDIGYHFSDKSPEWKDADSSQFLIYALEILKAHRYAASYIDVTIICQRPVISSYITAIQRNIANLIFGCFSYASLVSIKATTTDKLGFAGREEGIACIANISAIYKG